MEPLTATIAIIYRTSKLGSLPHHSLGVKVISNFYPKADVDSGWSNQILNRIFLESQCNFQSHAQRMQPKESNALGANQSFTAAGKLPNKNW